MKRILAYFKKILLPYYTQTELQFALFDSFRNQNEIEYEARLESVRDFLHNTLPILDPVKFSSLPICESGKYNYFPLPSNKLVTIDFFIPQLALFIVVPDIKSASWEEASMRGVTRKEWEEQQADLDVIERELLGLPTLGSNTKPKLLVLKWSDTLNHITLQKRLFGMIK